MSKCKGCGKLLQNTDKEVLGYTPDLNNKLCERCFKIKNYNYHETTAKTMSNDEIIDGINKKKACTLFLCDILNLNEKNIALYNKINSPKALVVTKIDILPNNMDLNVLRTNIKRIYNIKEVLFSSVKTNAIENKIGDYIETYEKVVLAGPTSSGKSTLINYLFHEDLTVSSYKNTTLEFINLKYDNLTIIDAPGFNDEVSYDFKVDSIIKPKTLILKKGYEVTIDKIRFYAKEDANITLYIPKNIIPSTRKVKGIYKSELILKDKNDLVINNLGFVYFKNKNNVYISDDSIINVRESLVASK